jgi:hypothetical protein
MKAKEKNQLAITKVLLVLLAAIGVLAVVWFAWIRPEEDAVIDSFEECKAAGQPILLSYPEQCVAPDGKTYPNPAHSLQ